MKQLLSMNKKAKKALIIVIVAVLVAAGSIGAAMAAQNSSTTAIPTGSSDTETLTNTAVKVASNTTSSLKATGTAASGDVFKDETVYVKTDANGGVQSTTVSDWLKNAGTRTQVGDTSSLSDIKNVKGDETYTQNADGTLTWQTQGKDIYYQGTTSQSLPVTVAYTYKLNGQSMSPQDMVGKSGNLEIDVNYTNNSQQNGVYTPFTVVTAMMLPTDNFTNVTIDNGSVVSNGNDNVVIGLAFPGLTSDLGLNTSDINVTIPESVKVTATVSDFKMDPMVTCVTSDIIKDADLSTAGSFDELDSDINKLTSATDELVAGSLSAKDGADQLASGTSTLQNGVSQYTAGVATANDGSSKLASGANTLATGAGTLSSTVNSSLPAFNKLAQGIAEYTANTQTIADGLSSVETGTTKLDAGLSTLVAGYATQASGSPGVAEGAQQVAGGTSQVSSGIKTLINTLTQKTQTLATESATYKSKAATLEQDQKDLSTLITSNAGKTLSPEDAQKIGDLTKKISQESGALGASTALDSVVTDLSSTEMQTQLGDLSSGAADTATGADEVNKGINGANGDAAAPTSDSLYGGTKALQSAVEHKPTSSSDSPGLLLAIQQLAAGSQSLVTHNTELTTGGQQLVAGGNQLAAGANQLSSGASGVSNGASALSSGLGTLNSNSATLNSGASQVASGTSTLASGLGTLSSGMSEFKTSGIDKIASFYNNDFKGLKDKLTNIDNAGKGYTSFSGISSGMDGSVKFVIETSEVK